VTGSLLKSSGWNGSSPFLTLRASDAETFTSQATSAAPAAALPGTNNLPNDAEAQPERGMESLAAMIVNFVNSTGALIQGLDAEVSFRLRGSCNQADVDGTGRCQTITTSNEKARIRYRTRQQVHLCGGP
jgi:hypothetical protein